MLLYYSNCVSFTFGGPPCPHILDGVRYAISEEIPTDSGETRSNSNLFILLPPFLFLRISLMRIHVNRFHLKISSLFNRIFRHIGLFAHTGSVICSRMQLELCRLRHATATGRISLTDNLISAEIALFFVLFTRLAHTGAMRIMKLFCVCVQCICNLCNIFIGYLFT